MANRQLVFHAFRGRLSVTLPTPAYSADRSELDRCHASVSEMVGRGWRRWRQRHGEDALLKLAIALTESLEEPVSVDAVTELLDEYGVSRD